MKISSLQGAIFSENGKKLEKCPFLPHAFSAFGAHRGRLSLANKKYESALHCFQAAQVERSQDSVALLELTEAYFAVGNTRAARESAEWLARISGLEPAMHFSLGLLLAKHSEYELAAQQFAAIPVPDRDPASDLNLGMAYSNLRRFQEARAAYAVCYGESWSLESFVAVTEAADNMDAPIITGFNGGFLSHEERSQPEDLAYYAGMGLALRDSEVRAVFLLNETDDFPQIERAISLGFNAVMVENEHLETPLYRALLTPA